MRLVRAVGVGGGGGGPSDNTLATIRCQHVVVSIGNMKQAECGGPKHEHTLPPDAWCKRF